MIDALGWLGEFDIKVKENGKIKEEIHIKNRITNLALQKIINILDNIDPDLDIKYLAVGTGTTAIDDDDTQLGNEIFRTPFQTSDNTGTGAFETTFTILDTEAVDIWGEIAIFCGDSATLTANTGNMLTRILYNRDKTSLEELEFTRKDGVTRA